MGWVGGLYKYYSTNNAACQQAEYPKVEKKICAKCTRQAQNNPIVNRQNAQINCGEQVKRHTMFVQIAQQTNTVMCGTQTEQPGKIKNFFRRLLTNGGFCGILKVVSCGGIAGLVEWVNNTY